MRNLDAFALGPKGDPAPYQRDPVCLGCGPFLWAGVNGNGAYGPGLFQTSVASEQRHLHSVDESASVLQQVRELTNERGIYAFRSPQVLEPLSGGLSNQVPAQIHVLDRSTWSRQASDDQYRNPLFVLFRRPDYAFVVGSVLSLVALFFTFSSVCGEKEKGMLHVMFAAGISRDRYCWENGWVQWLNWRYRSFWQQGLG